MDTISRSGRASPRATAAFDRFMSRRLIRARSAPLGTLQPVGELVCVDSCGFDGPETGEAAEGAEAGEAAEAGDELEGGEGLLEARAWLKLVIDGAQ